MSPKAVEQLNGNGFCVVEAKDPARVKFIDPIPSQSSRTEIEDAAIKLSRVMLNGNWRGMWNADSVSQSGAAHIFCQFLMQGTALDSRGTIDDQKKEAYQREQIEEMRRVAREDVRAERVAAKAALLKEASKTEASK